MCFKKQSEHSMSLCFGIQHETLPVIQCALCWVMHQSHVQLVKLGKETVAPACGVSIKLAQEQAVLYLPGYMSNWLRLLLFEQGRTPIGFIFCCLGSKQNWFFEGMGLVLLHICAPHDKHGLYCILRSVPENFQWLPCSKLKTYTLFDLGMCLT